MSFWFFVIAWIIHLNSSQYILSNWTLQSSNTIGNVSGSIISTTSYNDSNWYKVKTPCTVLAGLIQNNVYSDIYYGLNLLENINYTSFQLPWWYRNEFSIDQFYENVSSSSKIVLTFNGINYRSNFWFNGKLIENEQTMIGTLRIWQFDITQYVLFSHTNIIALEIFIPHDSLPPDPLAVDLAISFIDWNPIPPDRSMGIWKHVHLNILSPKYPQIVMQYAVVNSTVNIEQQTANVSVMIELINYQNIHINDKIYLNITDENNKNVIETFESVTLSANETLQYFFKTFNINNCEFYWPYQFGKPYLYNLSIQFGDNIHNIYMKRIGIREITSELITEYNYRLYKVNSKPFFVNGGGYVCDLIHRYDNKYFKQQFTLLKYIGLNSIRLEGKWPTNEWFDIADEMGIMILPGIECCDAWQHWHEWNNKTKYIAKESITSQIKRLRIHPSNLLFMYSSDELPPKDIEITYLNILKQQYWPNPSLATCNNWTSDITGPSGVKMSGPYAYEPPNYWLESTQNLIPDKLGAPLGGAFGFLSEGGPGSTPLNYDSLMKTIPKDKLWPINVDWDWHCGNQDGAFGNLRHFTKPLDKRYGESYSALEYSYKSGVAAYEAHRGLFEGYVRNKYNNATGLIHWMLNNAWPSNIWNIYDYYLDENGVFYATKKSVGNKDGYHLMYSYANPSNAIYLITNPKYSLGKFDNLMVICNVRNLNGTILDQYNITIDVNNVEYDSSVLIQKLNDINEKLYFIELLLIHKGNNGIMDIIDRNVYWLSNPMDVLDWGKSQWDQTPIKEYADFTALNHLNKVNLQVTNKTIVNGEYLETSVIIENQHENTVAFMINVKIIDIQTQKPVLPQLWTDNWITLFPDQTVTINATYSMDSVENVGVRVQVYNNIVSS
eukprot:142152_1